MQSPLLPWEVIERAIGHSGDHLETLISFSLTCRQLRPRALCFMVADADFKTRDQIFAFCDFLQAKPHLKPLVRSIVVNPVDFAPFPLLHILPNLSEISFVSQPYHLVYRPIWYNDSAEDGDCVGDGDSSGSKEGNSSEDRSVRAGNSDSEEGASFEDHDFDADDCQYCRLPTVLSPPPWAQNMDISLIVLKLNPSTLTCCECFSTRIHSLRLSGLSFSTYLDFARVLLSFTNLMHLACANTIIRTEGGGGHFDVMKQRLSERLHLLTVDIDFNDSELHPSAHRYFDDAPCVTALLLDSGLVQSTVETLSVRIPYRSCGLSQPSGWPHLRSLTLRLESSRLPDAVTSLKEFLPSTRLRDVVVQLELYGVGYWGNPLLLWLDERSLGELEQSLIRYPQPRLVWLVDSMHEGSASFWTAEIGQHVPALFQRGAFTVTAKTVLPGTGHDAEVRTLATSPDGKWVATTSWDHTIILWDTTTGAVVYRWIPHSYNIVRSLAFSPESRFLASSADMHIKIWDLATDLREVTTLEWDARNFGNITGCMEWSPNGDIIAIVCGALKLTAIQLWDARDFHMLYKLEHADSNDVPTLLVFSPDGRWLVSGSTGYYCIWEVASGMLYKSLPAQILRISAAVFDPGSARLLVAEHNVVKCVDIETGEERTILQGSNETRAVAFSPDGTLVLTGSENQDRTVVLKVWDAYTGNQLFSLKERRHRRCFSPYPAIFSPCGKYVAWASPCLQDYTVRLWKPSDGLFLETFLEHKVWQMSHHIIAFSQDGETLVLWLGDTMRQ